MATKNWIGGTTAVTQVDTLTFSGGPWTGSTVTTTLTAENNSTQTVVTTVTAGHTDTQMRDAHLTALQASTQSLFTKITFATSGSAAITATAKVSGVPFSCTASDTDGTGTYARAATTANSGPNDWNTAANWFSSGVPASADDVKIGQGSYSILYGLWQAAVSLNSLRVSMGFRGDVGDFTNTYYLRIGADNTGGGNVPVLSITTSGNYVLIDGIAPKIYVNKTSRAAKAVQFGTNSNIDNLYINGVDVAGGVIVEDSVTIDNVDITDCPGSIVDLGTGLASFDSITVTNGGTITLGSQPTTNGTIDLNGGTIRMTDNFSSSGIVLTVRGGNFLFLGDKSDATNTLPTLRVRGGTMDLRERESPSMTISSATVWGGTLTDEGGQGLVTYTGGIIKHGGTVDTDSGATITVAY